MVNLLERKWDKLKEAIELLKPYASIPQVRKQIRELKDEASVLRFALEKQRNGLEQSQILEEMAADRLFYKRMRSAS